MKNTSPLLVRPHTSDVSVFRQIYIDESLGSVKRLRTKPKKILDLGAYTGISTRWLADTFPSSLVVGIEPHPALMELARTNAPNAALVRIAVGAESAWVEVHEDDDRGDWATHTRESDVEGVAKVRQLTMSQIVGTLEYDVVKLDVEGAEKAVFEGDLGWLESVQLLLVETHDRFVPGCTEAMYSALSRCGRKWTELKRRGSSADHAIRFTS